MTLRRLRAAARRDLDREAGTTLAEMLVTMMITGILLAAIATMTIGFTRSTGQITARQDQVDAGRTASERVTKLIRSAVRPSQLITCADLSICAATDAFISATPTTMSFYSNLNNANNATGPSRVTYTVATTGPDAGVLIEKIQVPDSPLPSSDTGYAYCNAEDSAASTACKLRLKTRRLTTGVVTDVDHTLFRYYSNEALPTGDSKQLGVGTPLTGPEIDNLLSVEVSATVQVASPTHPKPTTYIQRVLLPNSQAVLRPGTETTP
ncbi:PilW family protein [Cellulomonas sp. URHD0024]|uniref:PilW family protein n=1 Tax=Cellulomonas sp. URHD0024 TaxID=1302620 RepID=UPI0004212215|nr:hypothetical protein [Cellulomonas sp. URHD0024]